MHVVIIGAGIIGTLSAYYLARKGARVTVLERNSAVASEASSANASQLSFSSPYPIGNPSLIPTIPSTLVGLNAGIELRKWLDWRLWLWNLKFLTHCTPRRYKSNTRILLELAGWSRALMNVFLENNPIEFSYSENGKLRLYNSDAALDNAIKQYRKLGMDRIEGFSVLSAAKCLEANPMIANRQGPLSGGILFSGDCMGDSVEFCKALEKILSGTPYQVEFKYNVTVDAVKPAQTHSTVTHLETSEGDIRGDAYLLCAGAYTPLLLNKIGTSLPVYPIKGCSIVVPYPQGKMRHSITDIDRKLVMAPLRYGLKISAGMLFDGYNRATDSRLLDTMKTSALKVIPELDFTQGKIYWGLRPAVPSSIPVVKKAAGYDNLYVNAGHGMWGWTLSHATCERAADIMMQQ